MPLFGEPGSGQPTQNIIGLGAGLLGNLIFPGAGLLLGPLAKGITGAVQNSGGPNSTPPTDTPPGGAPQSSNDSKGGGQSGGPASHYSLGGVPAPGGLGGVFGQGSGGTMPFWQRMNLAAYNRGDPGMGLDNQPAIVNYAKSLQVSKGAIPSFAELQPYLQQNKSIIGGNSDFFGPMGKQMSAT